MKPEKKKKKFDCLAIKERIQREIYDEIKDLTPEEEVEYFRKKAKSSPLLREVKSQER